jgi:hypothetical protein
MTKPIEYWRSAWDNAADESHVDINAGKTLNLLSQYAGFYKKIPILGFSEAWGGKYGRFFSGRWSTQHGSAVENAIGNFYHMAGVYAHTEEFHSVEFILACVKRKIGNSPINPNGNLAKILEVIKEKTSVDYATLDAETIHTSYHARA